MTNKEQLAILSPEQWWCRVDWLYHKYGKKFTDSAQAIMSWLEEEYKPVKPIEGNTLNSECFYCPVCYTIITDDSGYCHNCITEFNFK